MPARTSRSALDSWRAVEDLEARGAWNADAAARRVARIAIFIMVSGGVVGVWQVDVGEGG